MQVSIERLRVWLLLGAGGLLLVLGGFLGYAHLAAHRLLKNLPGRLGAEISREADGFTYSQSNGKRTLYTIHAARFVQHKDNRVTLRDVGIVLYDTASRADRIYGKEFEYDQTAGILRATGDVFLDLAAPVPADSGARAAYAAGSTPTAGRTSPPVGLGVLHVKTSGVVFAQKLGLASTDGNLEFESGEARGSATGAEFHSDTGVTVLRSRVLLTLVRGGRPVRLTADRAEFDRQQQQVRLDRAEATLGRRDGSTDQQTATAAHATLLLRTPAVPERIEAEGVVTLTGRGATVRSDRGAMVLGASDQPRTADLAGNVRYTARQGTDQIAGNAGEAHARFNAGGELERVLLGGGAHVRQGRAGDGAHGGLSDRTLTAKQIELHLAGAGEGRRWLDQVTASGSAHFVSRQVGGAALGDHSAQDDDLAADVLVAHLRLVPGEGAAGKEELVGVEGDGHTAVRRVAPDGAVGRSVGDSLRVTFAPADPLAAPRGKAADGRQTIRSADQIGHVHLDQQSPARPGHAATVSHGRADRLTYDGALAQATLLGNVAVEQPGSLLWADRVTLAEATGDAAANGRVKLSYRTSAASEAVEVLAARAELEHDSGLARFFGAAATPARMWQGGSATEAPFIELRRREGTLAAHGLPGSADLVHTVLTSGNPSAAATLALGANRRGASTVRVLSRELLYADAGRTAAFTGAVELHQADTTIHAEVATVFLVARTSGPAAVPRAPAFSFGGGALDHIVATGGLRIEQPGREATGDRLVYTAADRASVLTGSAARQPVVTDAENGTVSGAAIRFTPGDNGQNIVVVSGGGSSQPKLRQETRARPR